MTVDQAVKKFKLEPLNVYTAKAKAKERPYLSDRYGRFEYFYFTFICSFVSKK